MGLFKKSEMKQGVEAILQEDPKRDSGLTEDAEKAVTFMALKLSFKGLALALKHPSPKVRKHIVGMIELAGNVVPEPGGGARIGFSADGSFNGPGAAQAVKLLKTAVKDSDDTVSAYAKDILDKRNK